MNQQKHTEGVVSRRRGTVTGGNGKPRGLGWWDQHVRWGLVGKPEGTVPQEPRTVSGRGGPRYGEQVRGPFRPVQHERERVAAGAGSMASEPVLSTSGVSQGMMPASVSVESC